MIARSGLALLQKAAALLVVGLGLGLAAVLLGSPLVDAVQARDASLARLNRFGEALAVAKPAEIHIDPRELAGEQIDEGAAQLTLQADIDRLAKKAGLAIQTLRPLPPDKVGPAQIVWIEAALSGDLQSLSDFMVAADAARPVLLMRKLEINRGPEARPDTFLSIRAEIGVAWRPGAAGSEASK